MLTGESKVPLSDARRKIVLSRDNMCDVAESGVYLLSTDREVNNVARKK